MNEAEFDREWIKDLPPGFTKQEWQKKWDKEFGIPEKTINDIIREIEESNG